MSKRVGECVRCGTNGPVARHHIEMRMEGGGDEEENLEDRCVPCHQYIHSTPAIIGFLERERRHGQADRIVVAQLRFDRHEEYNSVEQIRLRGTYKSYWDDKATHVLPLIEPTPELKERRRVNRNKRQRENRALDKRMRGKANNAEALIGEGDV